jgi:hypothetical protein
MKQRIVRSFVSSIEWRLIAFVITNLFLWFTSGEFWQATILALELQVILLVASFFWFLFRHEKRAARPAVEAVQQTA